MQNGSQASVLFEGQFSPKLKTYMMLWSTLVVVATVAGIVLLPIWAVLGTMWVRRYFDSLDCILTERAVVVRRGVLFRNEMSIPLDKIQDISLREGPLLRYLGLAKLRIETAGQNVSASGTSEADLVGLLDVREVRDRILAQRDLVAGKSLSPTVEQSRTGELLREIRDVLVRMEGRAGGGMGA